MTAIPDAFVHFAGWTYGYPVAVPPGMAAPTGDPARDRLPGVPDSVPVAYEPAERRTVCTGLTAWCLLASVPALRRDGVWADLQIADHARPWSPVERVAAVLGGSVLSEPPTGWSLAQTWTGLRAGKIVEGSTGHARLVHVGIYGDLTVYEASRTHGIRTRTYDAGGWLRWGETTRFALVKRPIL